jgi:hypothetical protein
MAGVVTAAGRASRYWLAAGLWLVFFVVYNANGREIPSGDSQAAKLAAIGLARHHTLTLDGVVGRQPVYAERQAFVKDVDGHWRNAYPLPPVVEAATVAAALHAVGILPLDAASAPALAGKITASLLASLAGLFAFLTARRICGTPAAALVAAGFALGTGMWPVASQTLWQHATAVCSAAAAIWLWSATDRPGAGRMAAIGLLLGWAGCARPQIAPMIVVLAAGLLRPATWAQRIAGVLAFLTPIAILSALNVLWFGDPRGAMSVLHSVNWANHGVTSTWREPIGGLLGLLFSPSRGLLIFSPIALLPLAARNARPEQRALIGWTAAAAAVQLLLYASYSVWWGGFTYGPRYVLDLLPALVPAAALGAARLSTASRTARALAGAALVWSLVTSATGAFCFPNDSWNVDPESVNRAHGRLWEVRDSQILRCWSRGISPQNFALFDKAAWRRAE